MNPCPDRQRLWTLDEVAEYLQTPKKTLYDWRSRSIGPRGIRVGRNVRYRPEDVDAWLDERSQAA